MNVIPKLAMVTLAYKETEQHFHDRFIYIMYIMYIHGKTVYTYKTVEL